jgi:lysophospholipid acyltransferase (LPLAT)-like uncharacterized protein
VIGRASVAILPPVASLFIRMLHALVRARHARSETIERMNREGERYVFALWHAHFPLMVYSKLALPLTVMISQSRDGELIARTLAPFGIAASRGSSSRGGRAALVEMLGVAARGENLAFTPDGPRGPRHVAQMGVVVASQATGLPVLPVALLSRPKVVFRSWDRTELPMPFARVIYLYGEPVHVPRRLAHEEMEQWRLEIESRMKALVEEGERDFEPLWSAAEPARVKRPFRLFRRPEVTG